MSTAAVSGVIGALAAAFIASYFGNRPAEISASSGRRLLHYAIGLRILVDVIVAGLAAATIHAMITQPDYVALHVFMILFTVIAGGYLVLETHFSSIEYDEDIIIVRSLWQKNREIPWNDLESVSRLDLLSMSTIHTKTRGKLYLLDGMSGVNELVARASQQCRRR